MNKDSNEELAKELNNIYIQQLWNQLLKDKEHEIKAQVSKVKCKLIESTERLNEARRQYCAQIRSFLISYSLSGSEYKKCQRQNEDSIKYLQQFKLKLELLSTNIQSLKTMLDNDKSDPNFILDQINFIQNIGKSDNMDKYTLRQGEQEMETDNYNRPKSLNESLKRDHIEISNKSKKVRFSNNHLILSQVSSSSASCFHKNENQSYFKSTENDNETTLNMLDLYYLDSQLQ